MQRTAPSGGHLPDEAGERGWPPSIYNVPSTTINWNRWDGYWEDHWEEIDVESLWKVLPTVLPYPASCKNLSIWLILLHWDFLTVSPLCPWSFVPPCSSLLLTLPGSVHQGTTSLLHFPWLPIVHTPPRAMSDHGSSWPLCIRVLGYQQQKVTVSDLRQKELVLRTLGHSQNQWETGRSASKGQK